MIANLTMYVMYIKHIHITTYVIKHIPLFSNIYVYIYTHTYIHIYIYIYITVLFTGRILLYVYCAWPCVYYLLDVY